MSDLFDDIENEEAAADYNDWLTTGHYLCRIERMRAFTGEDKHDKVALDMTVLHVYGDSEIPVDKEWESQGKDALHRPGQEVTTMWSSKHQSAKRNLKQFLAAATGESADAITKAACGELVEKNLLAGEVIEVVSKNVKMKNGGPFTVARCRRNVPASEFAGELSEEMATRFFPNLEELIEAEE